VADLIPREFIDQVLSRTDIVSLVDSYIPLKKLGANFKACCPFHNEKSPSFVVSAQKQIYHCFGCGVGGNAISFLMEYEHLSFVESIKSLAKQLNIEVPTTHVKQTKHTENIDDYYDATQFAVVFYQSQLKQHPEAEAAKTYLIQRGLSGEIAARYKLGFAPSGWDNLQKGLKGQVDRVGTLLQAGLVIAKSETNHYDRFRERIIFPIRNRQGRYVGFGGRIMDQGEPKYLNSPETAIFHKSRELYGFYEMLKEQRKPAFIVIVEGYMDVLALAQHGIPEVVGTLGTATTAQHLSTLFRYTDEIVFCFDGDDAGKKAAWRALTVTLPIYEDGKTMRFMFLPDGEDPDSYVRTQGKEGFVQSMKSAEALSQFFLGHLCEGIQLHLADDRAKLLKLSQGHLKAMANTHLKQLLINELAAIVRLPVAHIEGLVTDKPTLKTPPRESAHSLNPLRHALTILLQHPKLASELVDPPFQAQPGQEILAQLLELIASNPNINTAGILEVWRDRTVYPRLLQLSSQPLLVPETGLLAELRDTLSRLQETASLQRVEELMMKAGKNTLSLPEKQELQELLAQSA
jgi:DNA primase